MARAEAQTAEAGLPEAELLRLYGKSKGCAAEFAVSPAMDPWHWQEPDHLLDQLRTSPTAVIIAGTYPTAGN